MDIRAKLQKFFQAKNQKYVVLKVVDLMKLEEDDRRNLVACLFNYGFDRLKIGDDKRYFLQYAHEGYLKLSISQLFEKLDMHRLEQFQDIVFKYQQKRFGNDALITQQTCDCVIGDKPSTGCKKCDGKGVIRIWNEISKEEQLMAEGKI